eukprot:gene17508-20951_t
MSNLFKSAFFFFTCLITGLSGAYAQQVNPSRYSLIPYPQQLEERKGEFVITTKTILVLPGTKTFFQTEIQQLQSLVKSNTGQVMPVQTKAVAGAIVLKKNDQLKGEEDYTLEVGPKGIEIAARNPTGMFRGIETLRQLMPVAVENGGLKKISVPAVKIFDHPAYSWRGMHLDVSRHFFSVAYLKKFINLLALYKMNKLHLHLTDDQGWRIEIKKYPLLTEMGAWREFNNQDSACMKM